MASRNCAFLTSRLLVKEWHALKSNEWVEEDLADVVADMLTEPVTQSLPNAWHGNYTKERARQWIKERDREGTTLLIISRSTKSPVGLMILFESTDDNTSAVELRLGYLLTEAVWGDGLASELMNGFIDWCRENYIASIVGGVARENVASQRVLEKSGFVCDTKAEQIGPDELLFRLRLRS